MSGNSFIRSVISREQYWTLSKWKNSIFPNEEFLKEKKRIQERKAFLSGFVKAGELCFDVGANFGNRVKPLLDLGSKVVAVEPQALCQQYLRWRFGKKITLVAKGLGAKVETREFFISDSHTLSSFSKDWIESMKNRFSSNHWDRTEKVEMTTLDLTIDELGVPVYIKIDAEGFEFEILKGLSKKVKMISFEYATPEQTANVISCLRRLLEINPAAECNYSVGESMKWALKSWIGIPEMIEYAATPEFINTGFGDLYVRQK